MMTSWDRRIRHIDRKVKPTSMSWLGLRSQLLKAKVKERRGQPSRNLPVELVLERVRIKFRGLDVPGRIDRIQRAEMHERLMERKRRKRDAARRRARPRVEDTRIYRWRRRHQWLRSVESIEDNSDETLRHGMVA